MPQTARLAVIIVIWVGLLCWLAFQLFSGRAAIIHWFLDIFRRAAVAGCLAFGLHGHDVYRGKLRGI